MNCSRIDASPLMLFVGFPTPPRGVATAYAAPRRRSSLVCERGDDLCVAHIGGTECARHLTGRHVECDGLSTVENPDDHITVLIDVNTTFAPGPTTGALIFERRITEYPGEPVEHQLDHFRCARDTAVDFSVDCPHAYSQLWHIVPLMYLLYTTHRYLHESARLCAI
jgi:hypothetical protein